MVIKRALVPRVVISTSFLPIKTMPMFTSLLLCFFGCHKKFNLKFCFNQSGFDSKLMVHI